VEWQLPAEMLPYMHQLTVNRLHDQVSVERKIAIIETREVLIKIDTSTIETRTADIIANE
jgi:hypothetical protein